MVEEWNKYFGTLESWKDGMLGKNFFSVLNPVFQNSNIPIFQYSNCRQKEVIKAIWLHQ